MVLNRLYQFMFNRVPMLTFMSGDVTIGSSGAVASYSGSNIASVTKLGTGLYRIKFASNFNKLIGSSATLLSPATGSNVPDGSFSSGVLYQITAVGTTNWHAIGLPDSLTAAVGQTFVATGVGGAGTGTAKAMTDSGLAKVEIAQDPQASLQASPQGATFIVSCYAPALTMASYTPAGVITNGSPDTFAGTPAVLTGTVAYALASPTSGSILRFNFMARSSSLNQE